MRRGGGYSGEATITLEIERYLHNGKLYLPDADDCPEDAEYKLFEIKVTGTASFAPGKLYGPPESCYPDEGDSEITEILYNGKRWEGTLTKSEEESALEQIVESICDDVPEPEPDVYDGDY